MARMASRVGGISREEEWGPGSWGQGKAGGQTPSQGAGWHHADTCQLWPLPPAQPIRPDPSEPKGWLGFQGAGATPPKSQQGTGHREGPTLGLPLPACRRGDSHRPHPPSLLSPQGCDQRVGGMRRGCRERGRCSIHILAQPWADPPLRAPPLHLWASAGSAQASGSTTRLDSHPPLPASGAWGASGSSSAEWGLSSRQGPGAEPRGASCLLCRAGRSPSREPPPGPPCTGASPLPLYPFLNPISCCIWDTSWGP